MKTHNFSSLVIITILSTTITFSQSREMIMEDVDDSGDVIIEMITNDAPTDPTHRNMILGFNQSNEGFLRMISDHDLSFWTDNNRRITIDKDGRIGLGESNPTVRMHVKSSGTANQQTIVGLLESNASDRPILQFSEGGGTLTSGMGIEYDGRLSGDDNKMHFNGIDAMPKVTITAGGEMGIGEVSPSETLDVMGNIGLKDGTGSIEFYEAGTAKANIDYNGNSISINTTEGASDVNLNPFDDVILNAGDDILFRSQGISMGIFNDLGNMGVGTTSPAARLDVRSAATTSAPNLQLRQLNSDFARLRMTSNSNVEYWDIIARSLGTDPKFNVVYKDGSTLKTSLAIDGDGQRTGINNTTPNASLHIKQVGSNTEGLRIENDGDTDNWGFEIGNNDLLVTFNGSQVGFFNDADGVYSPSSDRRLKENISNLENNTLEKIMALQAKSYHFKHDENKTQKSYGFMAQDVKEIFPDAVITNDSEESDLMAVKYQNLNVFAIKAIQEQQALILELQRQIDELKK